MRSARPSRCSLRARVDRLCRRSSGCWRRSVRHFAAPIPLWAQCREKYFNKIVADLKGQNQGTLQHQVLSWMMTLHGYLSSPTGGGIRHGADVGTLRSLQLHEARLLCNLIRSYVDYLLAEHRRHVDPESAGF